MIALTEEWFRILAGLCREGSVVTLGRAVTISPPRVRRRG